MPARRGLRDGYAAGAVESRFRLSPCTDTAAVAACRGYRHCRPADAAAGPEPPPSSGSCPAAAGRDEHASDGTPTVVVTFDSGPNAGTYTATGDPQCNYGVIGDDTWGAQFGDFSAGDGQLSTVQITDAPDTSGNGKQRIVSAFIVVGPIFGGTSYTLSLDRFSGDFTREIQDNGQSATIHIAGKSIETPLGPGGIQIDVVLSCPTVNRG